jgi:pimeloyl-ACP methyl ester carboxylesterase
MTPADLGLDYEEVSFLTGDSLTLRGWYIPSQNQAAILIAHGIASNRMAHVEQAAALARHGYGVLLFDLRAHGESEGDTTTFGGNDVLGAVDYLQKRPDVDPQCIGALGISLGGLVIVQAAAGTDDIRAVVADGTGPALFQDMPRPEKLGDWLWVPFDWVWFATLKRQGVTPAIPVVEALPRLAPTPLFLISGAGKRHERRAMQMYYAAAAEPKALWEIPEAVHAGGWTAHPEEYEARIVSFFDQALLAGDNGQGN